MDTQIIVALLALFGSLAGSYFSNRKSYILITYRLEQVEKKVDNLDMTTEIQKLRERVAILETAINDKT